MNAGDALIAVKPKVLALNVSWQRWLRENCLTALSTAQLYIQLAEHRAEIEAEIQRGVELSLRSARRLISTKAPKCSKPPVTPLRKAVWVGATPEDRRAFLDSIGMEAVLQALSPSARAELHRRVAGQHAAKTSALSETIAAGLRQALSLQKAARSEAGPAMGVAPALNAINNKLAAAGFDLNYIRVVIDPAATQKTQKKAA